VELVRGGSVARIVCLGEAMVELSAGATGGERSFTYWWDASAARAMFEVETVDEAEGADLLCFSLISLGILPPQGRRDPLRLAGRVRDAGGLVAFDDNYQPRLWESPEAAIRMRDKAIAFADIGLPTFEDEALLSGAKSLRTGSGGVVAN